MSIALPADGQDVVDRFADLLIDAAEGFDRPHLVRLIVDQADPDQIELGVKDLEGEHAGSALLGFVAPADWWAVGIATGAWFSSYDGLDGAEHELARGRAVRRPSADPDAVRGHTIALVARDGSSAQRLRLATGLRDAAPMQDGFVADVLRRVMGLPTPAMPVAAGEAVLACWLDAIVAAAHVGSRRRRLAWPSVVRLHPEHRSLPSARSRDLDALAATAAGRGWSDLRGRAERGRVPTLVHPDLARWFDDGSFGRYLLGRMPSLAVLASDAVQCCDDDAAARLSEAVDVSIAAYAATAMAA